MGLAISVGGLVLVVLVVSALEDYPPSRFFKAQLSFGSWKLQDKALRNHISILMFALSESAKQPGSPKKGHYNGKWVWYDGGACIFAFELTCFGFKCGLR